MPTMTFKNIEINPFDINYPCYVSAIPKNAEQFIHIPGQFEYKYLESVKSYIVEGYKTKDKLYLFDTMSLYLWQKQICQMPYEKRLRELRKIVTGQIANFTKVIDIDTVLVENPFELKKYCDQFLTFGTERVRIMDVNGNYVFGESCNGELMELKL